MATTSLPPGHSRADRKPISASSPATGPWDRSLTSTCTAHPGHHASSRGWLSPLAAELTGQRARGSVPPAQPSARLTSAPTATQVSARRSPRCFILACVSCRGHLSGLRFPRLRARELMRRIGRVARTAQTMLVGIPPAVCLDRASCREGDADTMALTRDDRLTLRFQTDPRCATLLRERLALWLDELGAQADDV